MICVWEQTGGPCFCWHWFKSSAWSKTAHGCYKLSARASLIEFLPFKSCTLTSLCLFPANTALSTFSYPHFPPVPPRIFLSLPNISIAIPFSPPQSFPYPYRTFTTCQEDLGLCGFCPNLGAVQLRLHWAGCRFVSLSKWPLLWFKLATRHRCRPFLQAACRGKSRSWGRERV